MLHPLNQKMIVLQRRAWRTAAVHGVCLAVTAFLGTIMVFGAIDYLLRFQDRGLRVIVSLLVLGALGWAFYRFLRPIFSTQWKETDLARLVQCRFPNLETSLISAVEFLRPSEDESIAGSAALRRAVIAQTTDETRLIEFSDVLNPRPTRRAIALLALACLLTGILIALAPSASRIAFARLTNPFGNAAWPRNNHLTIRNPVKQVARGQAFHVKVVDANGVRLPPDVRIQYRLEGPDGTIVEETERMQFAQGAMTARRENILRPFSYRVEGGDDKTMPWHDVQVVEPPAVESLSLRLIPPAYTGWPAAPTERHLHAFVGTQVQIVGKATKPLSRAVLHLEGGTNIPAQLSDDGLTFTIGRGKTAFVIEKSGSYGFELTDREGLHGGDDDRWEIRAIADTPPTVVIDQPIANLFVTPRAVVPIQVSVKDDLAIADIALIFRRTNSEPERSLPLFTAPKRVVKTPAKALASNAALDTGDHHVVDYRWDLTPLKLQPKMHVVFHATAGDDRPQRGESEPRRLIVVSPDEMQNRIADREKTIANELKRALRMQRSCRSQVESSRVRRSKTRKLEQTDVDLLQAAEHGQRGVRQVLTGHGEGVTMHIHSLMADLRNNHVESADLQRRISDLVEELQRLDREHLTPIGRELTAAVKTAQIHLEEQGGANGRTVASLAIVAKHQDEVVAALEQWLGRLAQWDGYRRFHREIGQLLREQKDVTRRTSEMGRHTLTQELRNLAPRDAANLKIVAERQLELARSLDHMLQKMHQSSNQLRQDDPPAADSIADALDEVRRLAIGGRMRSTGRRIEQNRIGQALAEQKQIALDLQDVLDILANRHRHELTGLEDAVKHLRHRQEDALKETRRLDELQRARAKLTRAQTLSLHKLARLQQKLRDDAVQIGKQLSDTGVFKLALGGAADDMNRAAQWLDHRRTGPPTQEAQQNALQRLDLLVEALKPEEPTTDESNAGGGDQGNQQGTPGSGIQTLAELRLLKLLQQQINLCTERLQQAVIATGKATEEHTRRSDELSRRQGQLADAALQSSQPAAQNHEQQPKTPSDIPTQRDDQTLDEDNWQRELGAAAEKEADNPMLEIAQKMRDVQRWIGLGDSGTTTRQRQREIIVDLNRLIQQARKGAGQRQSGDKQPQTTAPRTSIGQPGPKPGVPDGQKPDDKPVTTSSPRPPGNDKVRNPDIEQTRNTMKQLWGELPEHARQQMLQLPIEEFPLKYELLIEDYFRRLSEEKPRQ